MTNERNQKRAFLAKKLKGPVNDMIRVERDGSPYKIHPDMLKAIAGACVIDLTSKIPRLSPTDDSETFWRKMTYGTKWNQFDDLRTRSGIWVITDVVIAKTMHRLYQIAATLL